MTDPSLVKALDALDLAVVEVVPGHALQPFAPPPAWFKGLVHWSALPFLEHVLPEAEAFWKSNPEGALGFGPFTVSRGDEELLLRVRALKLDGRLVLAIDRLVDEVDPRPALRKARTQALELEDLSRRTRETHGPVGALAKSIEQLRQAPLSPEQTAAVDAMAGAVRQLQALTATFPPPITRGRQSRPSPRAAQTRDE